MNTPTMPKPCITLDEYRSIVRAQKPGVEFATVIEEAEDDAFVFVLMDGNEGPGRVITAKEAGEFAHDPACVYIVPRSPASEREWRAGLKAVREQNAKAVRK